MTKSKQCHTRVSLVCVCVWRNLVKCFVAVSIVFYFSFTLFSPLIGTVSLGSTLFLYPWQNYMVNSVILHFKMLVSTLQLVCMYSTCKNGHAFKCCHFDRFHFGFIAFFLFGPIETMSRMKNKIPSMKSPTCWTENLHRFVCTLCTFECVWMNVHSTLCVQAKIFNALCRFCFFFEGFINS